MNGRSDRQRFRRVSLNERLELRSMPNERDLLREHETPHALIGFEHGADLLPRRRHQILLLRLHYTRAEPRRHTMARIQIQFVHPVG